MAKDKDFRALVKELLPVFVASVSGLVLLNIVSDPRKTAQVVSATSGSQLATFITFALVFLFSSWMFLRKPFTNLFRKG
jgi:hypothetical protein